MQQFKEIQSKQRVLLHFSMHLSKTTTPILDDKENRTGLRGNHSSAAPVCRNLKRIKHQRPDTNGQNETVLKASHGQNY